MEDMLLWTDPGIKRYLSNLRKAGNWHKPLNDVMNALIQGQYFVFIQENAWLEGSTIDSSGVVAVPSDKAIEMILELHGFQFRQIDWLTAGISDWHQLEDYREGDRVSYTCNLAV